MPLVVMINPNQGELGAYQRSVPLVAQNRFKTNKIQFSFQVQSGLTVSPFYATPLVDGKPISEKIMSSANKIWTFNVDVPDGYHVVTMDASPYECIAYPFVVNTKGIKFPEQKPYTAATRFERDTFKSILNGVAQVEYNPTYKRPVFTLKVREFPKITTRLKQTETFTEIVGTNTGGNIMEPFFVEDLDGNVQIERQQKYFYSDVALTNGATPPHPLVDGPFGVGTLGFLSDVHINNEGTGFYFIDALGRFGFLRYSTGEVITIAGKRIKPGKLPAPSAYRKNVVRAPTVQERAFYDSKWEDVGTWDPLASKLREPWFVYPYRDYRQAGWHEFLIPNTRAHQILYINHLTAHAAPPRDPLYPPLGYVMPAEVRPSDVVVWLDVPRLVAQGIPQAEAEKMMAEPWGIDRRDKDGRIYWSCFQSGYICSANPDGSNAKVVFKSAKEPLDGYLGVTGRLGPSKLLASQLRPSWQVDGPIGTHVIVKPQAISFDSEGNLIWGERYVFNLRKGNPETGEVRTIRALPVEGIGDKFQYDVFVRVDRKGVMGAVDDIFVSCWGWNTDFRYGKDGVALSGYYSSPIRQFSYGTLVGPGEWTTSVGYNWPIDFNANHMVVQGTAGGSQLYIIRAKMSSDPKIDKAKFQRGILGYHKSSAPPMALTHGPNMQNFIQQPDMREMGSWDDAKLKSYVTGKGVTAEYADDVVYVARMLTHNVDYSGVKPPEHDHSHDQKIDFLTLTPLQVSVGETAVLAWGTTDATKVFLDGDEVSLDGQTNIDPTAAGSLTFKLTTEGTSHTPVQASITLTVKPKPLTEVEVLKAKIVALEKELVAAGTQITALKDEVESRDQSIENLNEANETIKAEESREEGLRVQLEARRSVLEAAVAQIRAKAQEVLA